MRPALPLFLLPILLLQTVAADELMLSPAVEPDLLSSPTFLNHDDAGGLFVIDGARIVHLEDSDADGVFDTATPFADGLGKPGGLLWIYDSLYVTDAPAVLEFRDEDGDGIAEIRKVLTTGFAPRADAPSLFGPYLHPNGQLFVAHGNTGYAIPDKDTGQILDRGRGAHLWTMTLSGSNTEIFATTPAPQPGEIDFTAEGNLFGILQPAKKANTETETIVAWNYGVKSPGPILSEEGIRSLARYRSGALNPSWQNQWLAIAKERKLIHARTFTGPSGGLSAETQTLAMPLEQAQDFIEDLNGDLLITGGPDGLTRLSRRERGYAPPEIPDWDRLTAEQVSDRLDADEHWIQDRAMTELAVRGDPAIPELSRIIEEGDASITARRNAVWTLARMKFSESTELLYAALTDLDPSVREAACNGIAATRNWQSIAANEPAERAIELERNRTISGALARIVRGDSASVASAAATALGRMAEDRAVGAVLGRLGRSEGDPFLQQALIRALVAIDDLEKTRYALQSENPATVAGALLALHAMPAHSFEVIDILPLLDDEDESLRVAAITVASDHPTWDGAIANRFYDWGEELSTTRLTTIEQLAKRFAKAPPLQSYLENLLESQHREGATLAEKLLGK